MKGETNNIKEEKRFIQYEEIVLPYGIVAINNSCSIDKVNSKIKSLANFEKPVVKFSPTEFPIKWDEEKFEISFCPDQVGKFSVKMIVQIPGKDELFVFPLKLHVNHDTKKPVTKSVDTSKAAPKASVTKSVDILETTPKISDNKKVDTPGVVHKLPIEQNINMQANIVPKTPTQHKMDTQMQVEPKTLINQDANMQKESEAKIILHKITLPNCKTTGIDYREPLEDKFKDFIKSKGIGELTVNPKIDHNAKFDINWDPEKYIISCHPDQAGDYEINLYADVIKNGKPEKHQFQFKLTVNPDPKSLWKNIPSNQDGVYAKLDCDKIFLPCTKNLSIVAASQRGRSHAQEGNPRDDDFIADWDAGTCCAVLITADGAGSAKFSRKGSQIATRTVLEKVKTSLGEKFWTDLEPGISKYIDDNDLQAKKNIQILLYKVLVTAAWEAKVQIKNEAEKHEKKYLADYKKSEKFTARDYATTLIVTIVKKLDIGGWFIATYWVGDGGMGVYQSNPGKIIVQGTPDGGEYGGQTRFLTEDSSEVWPQGDDAANKIIERRIHFDVVKSFDAVILMTDGITDPKFETDNNLNSLPKWKEFIAEIIKDVPLKKRNASVADAMLNWMDFWSPGNHDDRTMMILY